MTPVVALLALAGPAAAAQVVLGGQQATDPARPQTEPLPVPEAPPEAVRRARSRLLANDEDVPVLAIHARALIDADDLVGLHDVLLSGSANPIMAVLQALQTTDHTGLVPELVAVATRSVSPQASDLARQVLQRLGSEQPPVVDTLLRWLDERTLPKDQLATIVRVLGSTRDLAAVPSLIGELDGPFAGDADQALQSLTGHAVGGGEPWPSWPAFWSQNGGSPRDVLLERALERVRRTTATALQRMSTEVANARIERMGADVDKMVAALGDDHVAVRLEAARRLGGYPNKEQAANAVPVLLQRLGYGGSNGGTTNGHSTEAVEGDVDVRAAMISTLGILGRGQPQVQEALLIELQSSEGRIAAVTVEAFGRVRDQPEIVAPLLAFLGRETLDDATVVIVLDVVAANRPVGRLADLATWLDAENAALVRAAAVRAVLAGADVPAALELVEPMADVNEVLDVRYALAVAVGHRLRDLPAEHDARRRMLEMLRVFSSDTDASVRASAAGALGVAGDELALAILQQRARIEPDVSVMERIVHAVGELGRDDGIDTIGRICSTWAGDDGQLLDVAARRALLAIGSDRSAEDWLTMADTLEGVEAHHLAAWALRDTLHRLESSTNEREVLSEVRGRLAVVLARSGAFEEAHDLLVQLHDTQAAHPPIKLRLELLASTSAALGWWAEAADWYLERLAQLAEGEASRLPTQRAAADALFRSERYAEARPHLLELLDVDASDNELMFVLAQVHGALGDDDLARGTLARLLDRVPEEDMDFLAEIRSILEQLAPIVDMAAVEPDPGLVPEAEAEAEPEAEGGDTGGADDGAVPPEGGDTQPGGDEGGSGASGGERDDEPSPPDGDDGTAGKAS